MINEKLRTLAEAFKEGNIVLFIGSGISTASGLPSWKNLLIQLRKQFLPRSANAFFNQLEPIQQAQLLYDMVGRQQVINRVCTVIANHASPIESHRLLVSLPVQTIITTNWDKLIESAYSKFNKTEIRTIWKDDQISMLDRGPVLIKLHGTIEDPNTLIFSEDEYHRFASAESLISLYVKTLIATSTILFVGYGFQDFDFKLLYTFVSNRLGWMKKNAFIFQPNATEREIDYLEHRGLKPIVFEGPDSTTATLKFLTEVASETAIKASNNNQRLQLIIRENRNFLSRAKGLIIRNHSNLGPLATPDDPSELTSISDPEIVKLEVEAARSWKNLLKKGASAKCMVCLSESWLQESCIRRGHEIVLRLKALRNNLEIFKDKVKLADAGTPTNVNLSLYGSEVCLEGRKAGFQLNPYESLIIIRDKKQIEDHIFQFDAAFNQIREHNIREESDTNCVEIYDHLFWKRKISNLIEKMNTMVMA